MVVDQHRQPQSLAVSADRHRCSRWPIACPSPKRAVTNPKAVDPFPARKEKPSDVIYFTNGRPACLIKRMTQKTCTQKTCPASFDPKVDIGTDFALIVTGVGAALIALVYLILI